MLPEQVRLICANMMFNMGINRMNLFKKFLAAVEDRDWQEAASQMVNSRWNKQVPNRSNRLVERMRAVE